MKDWLSQQEESDTTGIGGITKLLEPVQKLTLDHVQTDPKYIKASNRFAVSESGAIGISCDETPSLSVMYPDTDKPPVILSNDMIYLSATFVKFRGKEHLAAACLEDGCLHLRDIASKTYKKVFDPKLPMDKYLKYMNICKIDDSTIGYGQVYAAPDRSRSVFILKTDTQELTLSSTLRLFTPGNIWDICYTEVEGGTPCLLLCLPREHRIVAVEMIGGRTRWEVGKEQMGEKFKPWSICTDQNNCVYVADNRQTSIHLLSASDGTVIKQYDVGSFYGLKNIFGIRIYDQHLYIQHKIYTKKVQKYAITKFKQIEEIEELGRIYSVIATSFIRVFYKCLKKTNRRCN